MNKLGIISFSALLAFSTSVFGMADSLDEVGEKAAAPTTGALTTLKPTCSFPDEIWEQIFRNFDLRDLCKRRFASILIKKYP